MDEDQHETWETTDLTTAAYLRALGIRYEEMRAENGSCVWEYKKSTALIEAITAYAMGDAKVEPEEFSRQLMKMRRRMFAALDGLAS